MNKIYISVGKYLPFTDIRIRIFIFFELRNQLTTFLRDKKNKWAELFLDINWNAKLAFLSDIFSKLNELNRSMQGRMATNFVTANEIDGFKQKLVAKSGLSRMLQ